MGKSKKEEEDPTLKLPDKVDDPPEEELGDAGVAHVPVPTNLTDGSEDD